MVSKEQMAEARTVAEDLQYLSERWTPMLDEGELRRTSPLLRRLLVDGSYARAWRSLGFEGEPWVSATDLDAALGQAERRYIFFTFAPPAPGIGELAVDSITLARPATAREGDLMIAVPAYPHFGPALALIPREVVQAEGGRDRVPERVAQFGRRFVRGYPLSRFLESSAAVVEQTPISRQDVVKYVANKLGGAHFDSSRERPGEERLRLLDAELGHVAVPGPRTVSAVYIELLSVGQFLAHSSDAWRFRAAFEKAQRQAAREGEVA